MSITAVIMMIIGMTIIWGGLALSISHAVKASKK